MFDSMESHWYTDIIRWLFAMIDRIVYGLLSFIYQIFFTVATADFISGQTVKTFYSRIQLILGVIIMFKVAISLFNGILNPDSLNNEKTGFGSIIKRIVMVLIMLMLLVPLNIPVADSEDLSGNSQISWNARMNENGILFGTLYELQSRLLSQNTISRLILGYSGVGQEDTNGGHYGVTNTDLVDFDINTGSYGDNDYVDSANDLAVIVLRCFITINPNEDGKDPTQDDDNRICSEEDDDIKEAYDLYNSNSATANQILSLVNTSCDDGNINLFWIGDKDFYAFSYSFIVSTIVGVLFLIIIVSFTIDAAIRVFKLAILRLIAPIPVLSYIDPKTQGTFQNWVKTVGMTFIDLFIRLAIINFAIFFIRELNNSDWDTLLRINGANWGVKLFAKIFIYLGLIMFAREAPKFILDTLGVKHTKGLFSGLAGAAGLASSWISGRAARRAALDKKYKENDPEKNSFRNRARVFASGLGAALGGAGATYHDYTNASDHKWRTAMDKRNRENAMMRANGEAGGGFWWGRTKTQVAADWTGNTRADQLNRDLERYNDSKKETESKKSSMENTVKAVAGEVLKKGAKFDLGSKTYKDKYGLDVDGINGNLKAIEAAIEQGKHTGVYEFNGREFDVATLSKIFADAQDDASDKYIAGNAEFADGSAMRQSSELSAMISEAKATLTADGYTYTNDTLRKTMKDAKDSYAAEVISLNTKIAKTTEDLKVAKADLRGNDGARGGK